jgi:hypothetical protein
VEAVAGVDRHQGIEEAEAEVGARDVDRSRVPHDAAHDAARDETHDPRDEARVPHDATEAEAGKCGGSGVGVGGDCRTNRLHDLMRNRKVVPSPPPTATTVRRAEHHRAHQNRSNSLLSAAQQQSSTFGCLSVDKAW